jgi:hypothetical protein
MDLSDLKARIDRAKEARELPLAPGESRAILPFTEYLQVEDWTVLWETVRAIRENHVNVFNRYPETSLPSSIAYVLGDLAEAPSLDQLAELLAEAADEQGPWLVSTPLANLEMTEGMLAVAERVVLQRSFPGREVSAEEQNDEVEAHFGIFSALGDYISPPARWLGPGRRGEDAVDTTQTAALLTVEDGTKMLATSRARAKALYAIAVWTITSPPGDRTLLADLGTYGPQPFLRMPPRLKELESGEWIAKKRADFASTEHWALYPVPGGDLLALPFEALALVRERRSAQALLSACWAAFQAARGSRFQLTERLRHVLVAVETLTEAKPGDSVDWSRWETLTERFGVHSELRARGYSSPEITRAEQRLRGARNIATHGADAVLIDLGYPEGVERAMKYGPAMAGEDLGFSALSADLTIVIYAIRLVLSQMLTLMQRSGWEDREFADQFEGEAE